MGEAASSELLQAALAHSTDADLGLTAPYHRRGYDAIYLLPAMRATVDESSNYEICFV